MKEQARIADLFLNLYEGEPWIDVTIAGTLKKISASKATRRVNPKLNTIWEITLHMISWRKNVLNRVHGKVIATPDNNYFMKVEDQSTKAWLNTIKQFDEVQAEWLQFLGSIKKGKFDKKYKGKNMTYYTNIMGILQHDAYHLGQIILIMKMNK